MEEVFIKKYWLREELGRSPHSIVYLATDSDASREVAVKKLIVPSLLLRVQLEDTVRNFLDEVEKRSRFSHESIAELYDCFEHEQQIYLAEELAKGKTLAEFMKSGRYYTHVLQGVYLFQKIAEALCCAHDHGYLHRNFKPENIIISDDNTVKLTDFMVCSHLFREQKVRTLLDIDRFENLTPYSAPGVVDGKPLTKSANIFSLGVLMYEFFTGSHPFAGHNDEELYNNIGEKTPLHAKSLNPSLPEVLNYMIERAMKKDLTERYGDLRELLDDMEYLYQEKNFPNERFNLSKARRTRNTLFTAREVSRKFIAANLRKGAVLSGELLKKIRKQGEEAPGVFLEEDLEPSKVTKKKPILTDEESAAEKEEASLALIPSPVPPEEIRLDEPLFGRRKPFVQENRALLLSLGAILVFLFGVIYLASYLYYSRQKVSLSVTGRAGMAENKGSAELLVTCNVSDADVLLERVLGDFPPIEGKLDTTSNWRASNIAPGAYMVKITKSGFQPYIASVELKENDKAILNAEIGVSMPSMDITTDPPDAFINIDGQPLGLSPLKVYDRKPGDYRLTIQKDGYETYSEKVTVTGGEVLVRNILLQKQELAVAKKPSPSPVAKASPSPIPSPSTVPVIPPAFLAIDSSPASATVLLDGQEIGMTPLEYTVKPFRSSVMVTLKKKDYWEWKDSYELTPGGTQQIFADLSPTVAVTRTKVPVRPNPLAKETQGPIKFSYEAHYSRISVFEKLSGNELVLDFDRGRVEKSMESLADYLENALKDQGGQYQIRCFFALSADTRPSPPVATVTGSCQVLDSRGASLLEESEKAQFTCSPEAFELVEKTNNYAGYRVTNRQGATESASRIITRLTSRIEFAIRNSR
ncbi:MAG: serine/threonine-protein kinase [Candidatus Eremiobacteraeota bacterium]|nr:serine/threonine-protein kinase [Candidatus Eremiobacteraeota bacterium]